MGFSYRCFCNIYFGGRLSDSIYLVDTILVSNIPESELLVVKFSPSGEPLWIKHTGGNKNLNSVLGIAVDELGNCYITGAINDICYFDTIMVNAIGGNPAFYIAKINPEGFFEWAHVAGRSLPWAVSIGYDIIVSKQNEIYVVGNFSYEINIQGILLTSSGEGDSFIAKFDQNGNLKWIRQIGGIHNDVSSSITVDSIGNCYVTGGVGDNARLGQFILHTYNGSLDGFVTKLDSEGNFLWVKNFGSNQPDKGNSIAYSPLGYIYLAGEINGTAFFDDITLQHNGGSDIFIASYDIEGNLFLAKGFGGSSNENVSSISINYLGNVLIAGDFDGMGTIDTTHLYSSGYSDLFSAEFDYSGNLDWIVHYGTPLKDYGKAVTTDQNDNVIVAGMINGQQGSVSQYHYSLFLGKIKNPVTPVDLVSFTSFYENNLVYLNWSIASELNNRGFEIERSNNKTDWRLIGFREGKGTTTEPQAYVFIDDLFGNDSYRLYYRLKQIDYNGSFEYSDVVEVYTTPSNFSLSQNYPNPFNPNTKIKYTIPSVGTQRAVSVQLKIYDVLGNEVATLVNEYKPAGNYEIEFAARDGLAAGIYFYQLKVNDFVASKKMLLLK